MNLQENLVVSERDSSVVVSRENECEVLMSQMSQWVMSHESWVMSHESWVNKSMSRSEK